MEAWKNLLGEPVFNALNAMKFVQFLFFGLNMFYAVIGTFCITIFFFINRASSGYESFIGWDVINLSIIFIVVGVILFIISIFGTIVAIKESTLLANVYAGIVLLLLIVELNATVTLFIMFGNIRPKMEMNMYKNFNNQTVQDRGWGMQTWNRIQQNMYCCGINGADDWAPLHVYGATVGESYYNDWRRTNIDAGNTYTVPFSCCRGFRASRQNNSSVECVDLKNSGCLNELSWCLTNAVSIVAITTGVMLLTQLAGCITAYILAKVIRRSKTSEEMKKEQFQHLLNKNSQDKEDTMIP